MCVAPAPGSEEYVRCIHTIYQLRKINTRDSVWSGRYGCELVGPKSGIRAGVYCRGALRESHQWLHLVGSRLGLEAHYLDPLMMPRLAPVLIICCDTALLIATVRVILQYLTSDKVLHPRLLTCVQHVRGCAARGRCSLSHSCVCVCFVFLFGASLGCPVGNKNMDILYNMPFVALL